MRRVRILCLGPLLAVLPGCGGYLRAGPQVSTTRGDVALQGQLSGAFGFADHHTPQHLYAIPVTLAMGAANKEAIVHLESGFEATQAIGDTPLGFRAGVRLGGALAGPSGVYLGIRGGPTLALAERGTSPIATISLEGFANIGTSGDILGYPTFGGALSFGFDDFGSFELRVPAGRPLRGTHGEPVAASLREGPAWAVPCSVAQAGLRAEERHMLGAAWLEDARMEHASIVVFARLSLELMSLGAPGALIAGARRAAKDEVRHARHCFGLAAAYVGRAWEPGELPRCVLEAPTLASLAVASLLDGAFGEGLAAAHLRARARRATEPLVKRTLAAMARDEARHAELAFDIVAFCLAADATCAVALADAWAALRATAHDDPSPVEVSPGLRAHGVLDRRAAAALRKRVHASVGARLAAMLPSRREPRARAMEEGKRARTAARAAVLTWRGHRQEADWATA